MKKNVYKTIIISDLHLGTSGSKAKEVTQFLKENIAFKLILNGDIIDGWQLKKYGKWKQQHSKFIKRILKIANDHNTEVIYLRGNHDDFLDQFIPFELGNIKIQRDYIHESFNKKYYVVHGDIFDAITTNLKWVAKLGDIGYTFLLWLNARYNQYRKSQGLPYYSLSQEIKAKVKSAVNYVNQFEEQLSIMAKLKKCDGIICGHIHQPAIKQINDIQYMNSGDWVESLTALVETLDGQWEIIHYQESHDEDLHQEDPDEEKYKAQAIYDLIHLQKELKKM